MTDTKPGTLYGVGAGPGDPELITLKGYRLLQSAPVVYIPVSTVSEASYARSIVEGYLDPTRQRIIELPFAMRAAPAAMAAQWEENARQIAAGLFQNQDAVFVTEGDPMLFSTFGHLAATLHALYPELPIQAVPGVSSITAAAAAAGIPLADRGRAPSRAAGHQRRGASSGRAARLRYGSAVEGLGGPRPDAGPAGRRGADLQRRAGDPLRPAGATGGVRRSVATGTAYRLFFDHTRAETAMNQGHVYFIGAGPGAPDLITVRGRDLISAADVVIFADSLVDPAMCDYARQDAQIIGSSTLTLEEIMATMIAAAQEGKAVVRLHSGDPALYGATHEQIVRLNEAGVPWSIVPGVSSAFAAAAILGAELTVPEITQTVIFSRLSGRASPVPPREELRSLASHGCSLVLFLSVSHMRRVVGDLLEGGTLRTPPRRWYTAPPGPMS